MAVFSPLGGQILELSLNGRQIIGGYAGQDTMAQIFGYTMAPWPNRLADGAYRFRDQFFQVEKLDEDNNANHGLVLKQQMEVISHSADSLTLLYSFGEDKCYPFAWVQRFCVHISFTSISFHDIAPFLPSFLPSSFLLSFVPSSSFIFLYLPSSSFLPSSIFRPLFSFIFLPSFIFLHFPPFKTRITMVMAI